MQGSGSLVKTYLSNRNSVYRYRNSITARSFGSGRPSVCDQQPAANECPSRACNQKPKRSFWKWLTSWFTADPKAVKRDVKKPDIRCCRKRWMTQIRTTDPDFSEFGGQAYKTCGIAYIIQRDRLPVREVCESREDRILRIIETNLEVKNKMLKDDPVQETENICGRLLEMADRGLHPLYKKIAAMPTSFLASKCSTVRPYQTSVAPPPIDSSQVPAQIKINWKALERKNIHWSCKRAVPPGDLIGRIKETKIYSKRPQGKVQGQCVESHFQARPDTQDINAKRKSVFDSLSQKHVNFCQQSQPICCDESDQTKDD